MREYSTIAVFAPAGTHLKGALRRADGLLKRGGRIWLLDVLPGFGALERAVIPERLQKVYTEEREHQLRTAAAELDMTRRVRVSVLTGNPVVSVVRAVLGRRVELLLKAVAVRGRGDSRLDALDMKLVRKCPCPVLVASARTTKTRIVLAAINPFGEDLGGDDINPLILDEAHAIATAGGANLHAVTAWSPFGETLMRRRLPRTEVDRYVTESYRRVERALTRELEPYADAIPDNNRHLERGEAADVIVELVERIKADVLVIGTIARSGIPGLLIGNTAETVMNRVQCEVLAVKPAGFMSPVADAG